MKVEESSVDAIIQRKCHRGYINVNDYVCLRHKYFNRSIFIWEQVFTWRTFNTVDVKDESTPLLLPHFLYLPTS